jgi:hypothetical protein
MTWSREPTKRAPARERHAETAAVITQQTGTTHTRRTCQTKLNATAEGPPPQVSQIRLRHRSPTPPSTVTFEYVPANDALQGVFFHLYRTKNI